MSQGLHIVVCGSLVPDPLQTLEPMDSPAGPVLKNEMMLPAVLDPWAGHALYEAAHLAKNVPDSKVWLVSLGPKAKLQQLMPSLIDAAAQTDDPDVTLDRLLQLIAAIARRTAYLDLLLEKLPAATEGETRFRLLFNGEPVAGVLVRGITQAAPQQRLEARTDANGIGLFPVLHAGTWLFSAVHMIREERDKAGWRSYWASMTFRIE